jgi:hypothetical protein
LQSIPVVDFGPWIFTISARAQCVQFGAWSDLAASKPAGKSTR